MAVGRLGGDGGYIFDVDLKTHHISSGVLSQYLAEVLTLTSRFKRSNYRTSERYLGLC
jgi:hypothetical protein